MKIKLKIAADQPFREAEFPDGTTLEEIAKSSRPPEMPAALQAKLNNNYADLRDTPQDGDTVELHGLEFRYSLHVYEDSLCLLYIAAVKRVLGDARVEIMNSLDQGMYTEIRGMNPVPESVTIEIAEVMQQMIDQDMPFPRKILSTPEAIELLDAQGGNERLLPLLEHAGAETVMLYDIDGTWHYPFGLIVPSAGYLKLFELKPYHRGVLLRYPNLHDPFHVPPYRDQPKLYLAFAEETLWNDIMDIEYVDDLNKKIEAKKYKELILCSEALHDKKVAEIADAIQDGRKRVVLVAGPSSSGKTTFSNRLSIMLKVLGIESICLGTDDFFVDRADMIPDENGELDFESLSAVDLDLFNRDMNALLAGEEVDLPTFNFLTGKKEYGKHITRLAPSQVIIIEGIHALNGKFSERIPEEEKYRVYISPLTQLNLDGHNRVPTTDERLLRRLVRDNMFRGHNAATTLELWENVRNGEDKNIFPYSSTADVLFNSYHVYEIAVLKKHAEPILRAVPADDPGYAQAQRLLQFLQYFSGIDDESLIVCDSILREFIGGSVYVD